MQKNVKSSLLLLALLLVLVLSISASFAQDIDNSTTDLAVSDNDESISIETQDNGYDEVSVENDGGCSTDSASVVNDEEKLGYAQSTSSAYIKFDQEDITITEGESTITIKGSLVDSQGNDPGGPDFPLVVYNNGRFIKYVDLQNHKLTYNFDSSNLVASSSPYKISFVAEEGPEYSGGYLEGFGGPEVADSWVMVTVNPATSVPETTDRMVEIDSGVVSGNAELATIHPWATSGNLVYLIPDDVSNIKSALVIVNVYSGSGANTHGLYSNITMDTVNGLEVLGFETLDNSILPTLTNNPNVYAINEYTTRQYSDYQMIYNITDMISDLNSGDIINISVVNSKISDLQFDGRIKLISLFFAYDDGDYDKVTYWLDAGQLWTQDQSNPDSASFDFNTQDYIIGDDFESLTLTCVGLSSRLGGIYHAGELMLDPDAYENGSYYQYLYWDDISDIFMDGENFNLAFTSPSEGIYTPSFKDNVNLLVAYEEGSQPVLSEAYVDYANGLDTNWGTVSAPFKTIEYALSVVGDNAVVYIADGVNYLDDVDVNGLNITKNVTIIGMGDNVVIDARNAGRIFKIQADQVSLSNLTFANADVSTASDKRGAALWVNGTILTIDNCVFIDNTAGSSSSYGGAINLKASDVTITDSQFDGNTAYYNGGAINAEKGNIFLSIYNCVFTDNQATNTASNWAYGAAICAYGTTIVDSSVFYGNSAKNGKSIYKYAGDLTISNSILLDGENSVFKYDAASQADLNDNWWGNNDKTKDISPKDLNYTNADVDSYLYLTLSTAASTFETTKPITIDVKLISQDTVNMPDIVADLSSEDGTFDYDYITLVNGKGNVQFTSNTVGVNTISVNVLGVDDSIELTFEEFYPKGQIVDKMVEIDSGVVSGNAEYVAINPWKTSGDLIYTIPEGVTDIRSVIVIINEYSGNGAQNYGLYSNVTLNTPNGLEVLAYDTLRMDEFPSFTNDPNVYGFNRYTTRQYSDYQMIFDITDKVSNLKSGDEIKIGVVNSKISDLQFDGRIKLISIFFAYDDGDEDNFTYWLNAGQLWTQGSESFKIDTSDYAGKDNNITIKSVALSSQIGSFKINNVNAQPSSAVGGDYYLYMTWDNIAPIFNKGQDTTFFFTCSDVGIYTPSFKTNAVLLVATELAVEPVLTEVYVDYAKGSDSYLGTTASAPFKTIEHALSVVGDNAVIHIADGVNYLDGADVSGLNISKNVTIIGMGNNVVIDAKNAGRIFKIQAGKVSLSNLIFINANTTSDSDKRGAALWVNGTTLTIDNCQFINNTAGPSGSYAGAITLKATNTTIKNSKFDGNTAYYTGAAVNAEKGNIYLSIDNCIFTNNKVTNVASNWANGAGICAYGTTVVTNSVFYNNEGKNGKSIYKYAGDLILSNSIILDGVNSVFKYDAASQADLNNNWWGNNDTTKDINPKDLNYTNADVDSYLYLNLTMYSKGLNVGDAAIVNINLFSNDGSDMDVIDLPVTLTAVNGNLNKYAFTLVNGRDGEVQYTITEVGNNTVTVNIFGIEESITLTSDDVISADVIYVDYAHGSNAYKGDSWTNALKNLEKAIDRVNNNGVIYVANGVTYLLDSTPASGIAISKNVKIIGESIDAAISGNDAKRIFNIANGFTLTITNLTLTNGYSTAQGGAIFINNGGAINISNSVIANSRANSAGGAIGATQGYINNINNVTFINNYAGNMGGAIGISGGTASNSAITIGDNNKFINNSASNIGSAIGSSQPPVTIGKNNLFESNRGVGNNGKGTVASNKITLGNGNVFVNNYASQGGALFANLNSGSATGSYCFFINNTDASGYALRQYGNKANAFTLDYCYWGTNTPDFNTIYNKAFSHNNYLVLSVSADKTNIPIGDSAVITVDITKNQNGQIVDVDSLPANVPLSFVAVNGNVTPENAELIKGTASVTYTPENIGEGSVVVGMYSVSETLNFVSSLPDVVISSVTTPWSTGIFAGVNNTFTVKVNNRGDSVVENLILEVYSNENDELIASYVIDSLPSGTSSILLTDPTVRPITEETIWPAAQSNKITFTFNLICMDNVISTLSADKMLAYDGYFNKTYAYGGHDNIINRNYTITGDIIVATQDVSVYADQYVKFRNETWNIETPEGAEIVKVLLYFAYNWDTSYYPNGWTLTFNDYEITNQNVSFEMDRGNLGYYGSYNYGLVVFDVTSYYNVNAQNSFVINKTGNCALYPSTLFVLYNMTNSDHIKDIYFSDVCDVFYPYYNSNGYDDLLKTIISFNGIDLTHLDTATLYAFGGSAGYNDADLSFNELYVTDAYPSSSDKECVPYIFDVTSGISQDNVAMFITSSRSSTVVAYEHVLVVSKKINDISLATEYTSVASAYAGTNNAITVTVDALKSGIYTARLLADGNIVNETEITLVEGTNKFIVIDPTIRDVDASTVNGADNNKVNYTLQLVANDDVVGDASIVVPVLYNGYLGKDLAYPAEGMESFLNVTVTGDIVVYVNDASTYLAGGTLTRTDVWTVSLDDDSTMVKSFVYVPYNWFNNKLYTEDMGMFNVTFNGATVSPVALYRDQGNLGNYGRYGYGVLVYDVTGLVANGENTFVLNKRNATPAVYPSVFIYMYNTTGSDFVKEIYISNGADLIAGTDYNVAKRPVHSDSVIDVDSQHVLDADLYVFAASAEAGEGNIVFNGEEYVNVWSGTSKTTDVCNLDITDIVEDSNFISFVGTGSTILSLNQIVVLTKFKEIPISLTTEYTTPTAYAGTNNAITVRIDASLSGLFTGRLLADGVVVNETEIILVDSANKLILIDPTIRDVDESTVNGAENNKVNYTFQLIFNDKVASDASIAVPVLYNGNLGKDLSYPAGGMESFLNVTISGDIVIDIKDVSSYMTGENKLSRSDVWTISLDENSNIVKAFVYVAYNWCDPSHVTEGINMFDTTFNGVKVVPVAFYRDQSNLGGYGKYGYGLLVYDVTGLIDKSGDNTFTLNKDYKYPAVYPSALVYMYNTTGSDFVKEIYISNGADLLANTNNVAGRPVNADSVIDVDSQYTFDAVLYVFASGAQSGEGNIVFNGEEYVNVWSGTSQTTDLYSLDITDIIDDSNDISFVATGSTILSLNQIIVITKYASEISIENTTEPVVGGDMNFIVTLPGATGTVKVNVNGKREDVPLTDGVAFFTISDLDAGNYFVYVSYEGNEYVAPCENFTEFNVLKIKPEISFDTTPAIIMEDVNVTVTVQGVTDGEVTVIVDGSRQVLPLTDGVAKFTIPEITSGDHSITAVYMGDLNHEFATNTTKFTVDKIFTSIDLEDVVVDYGEFIEINFEIGDYATGRVYFTFNGDKFFMTLEDGGVDFTLDYSSKGNYTLSAYYEGDENYLDAEDSAQITINGLDADLKANASDIIVGEDAIVDVEIDGAATGAVVAILDDYECPVYIVNGKGSVVISDLASGTYTVIVKFAGDNEFNASEATASFTVSKKELPNGTTNATMDIPEGTTAPEFNITLPSDATGNFTVTVDGQNYTEPLVNGSATVKVPDLSVGNHTISTSYSGDDNYDGFTSEVKTVDIPKASIPGGENAINLTSPAGSDSPTYSISLPSDATGNLTVTVDGKANYTAAVVNGSASVTVPGLSQGDHNIDVTYSGDGKFSSISKNTTFHSPIVKITNNKDVSVLYSGKASYKVLITKDGKAVGAGESVVITFNGKKTTVKTDSKGYATLNLGTSIKVKTYSITAEYKGVKVTNKVTIKNIIKASNKKVKKSKKVTKVKVSLKKVNGKVLKSKKLTIKFKGKTYKVKTNKKGVATWKVKKSMLKKLKVGKKYKYTVTYGKDVVTKKLTIKR